MPGTSGHILVVEDDDRIRAAMKLALGGEGYEVEEATDGETALQMFGLRPPALMIVDLMLPGMDGFEVVRRVRRTSQVPVIIVSARDDSHDVVAGLEAGADDYVTKPFVFKELAARIRAHLRRTWAPPDTGEVDRLELGSISLSPEEGRVWRGDEELSLTATEFRLLCELALHPRRVLSREQLLASVWGYDYYGDERIVDAHVRRLRTKLEEDPSHPRLVVTVRGLGYRFDVGDG